MEHKNREDLYATRAGSEHDAFSVQINTFDRYQSTPTPFDRAEPPAAPPSEEYSYLHVPIIRVFGSLPTGHNILVHIHGAFPYLYIPWFKEDPWTLQLRLERAVADSLKRKKGEDDEEDTNKDEEEEDTKTLKYIAHVSVVKGVQFYGYHVGYQLFFKVYLLNPSYINRMADLFREGHALGKKTDVFEAHIPYSLQFLTDYNLFGCGWLRLHELFIRTPILYDDHLKTDDLVEYMMGHHTTRIPRIGRSALEIDTSVQYILNRNGLKERSLHHNFVEKFGKEDMKDFVYIQSTKDLWKDGDFQRKQKGEAPYCSPPAIERNPAVEWVESEENAKLFEYVKKMNQGEVKDPNFATFVKQNPLYEKIQTAFESVAELFHEPQFENGAEDETATGEVVEEEYTGLSDPNDLYNAEQNAFAELQDEIDQEEGGEEDSGDDQLDDDLDVKPPSASDKEDEDEEEDEIEHRAEDETTVGATITDATFVEHYTKMAAARKTTMVATVSLPPTLPKLTSKLKTGHRYIYKTPPPARPLDFEVEGLPRIHHPEPFYMEEPPKPFVHAGRKFQLHSKLLEHLPTVPMNGDLIDPPADEVTYTETPGTKRWMYMKQPPTYREVWKYTYSQKRASSQVITQRKFKFATQKTIDRRPDGSNKLTVLIVEVFVPTRDELRPDPSLDGITAVFFRTMNYDDSRDGMICLEKHRALHPDAVYVEDEFALLTTLSDLVVELDPDIIAGYEVHASSWGYIIDRAKAAHAYDFLASISRVTFKSHNKMGDHWGYTHTSAIKVCGRHVINIWRPLKEHNLAKNSMEYVSYHLLHWKIPYYTHKTLTELSEWNFNAVVKHLRMQTEVDARLIETAEIVERAVEHARLIGVDFYDVFYRGSQFKVESLMTRIAKSENFLMLSPSKKQVRMQKPIECIPLVMEPISQYYNSPLLVLDFQSLYPSIVIAYNYCYSTVLGRLKNYSKGFNPIGCGRVKHQDGLLSLLEEEINLSPNGLMFVKSSVRKSLLAKMLEDLLDTRFMVKSTMKFLDPSMQQLYHNRQLALKLTANVTYGYTSASFSGRMPCSDIADAIVQTGRETLERAISMIEGEAAWGAKVVYGDTDSLFVYLPGRSRAEAFKVGKEMAEAVTKANPNPVTLKFEKVYHPAVLMAKKRYVGYSYEHLNSPPKFDAKGIETVRRDGHPAQQYIVEQCLRTVFETANLTEVKKYVLDQFNKIMNNDVSIQDFCFARAVRVGTYKNPPPGAVVSEKKMAEDKRTEPQYKERVPYVIIEEPNSILRERARAPADFIKYGYTLDSEYYIVKTLIPPLERIFSLMGADVRSWYTEMPRSDTNSSTSTGKCLSCGSPEKSTLCEDCRREELQTVLDLMQERKQEQLRWKAILAVSRASTGVDRPLSESHDCSVYFARVRQEKRLAEVEEVKEQTRKLLKWE